jgi:hypothetical protein
MELTGLEKIVRKIRDDPELFEIYETARQQAKHEEPEPLPKLDFLAKWTRILELRAQWHELFENWPKDRSAKEVRTQLTELREEEHRLLAEIAGERKTDLIAPLKWFASFVFPTGSEAACLKCDIQRHVTTEEIAKWLKAIPKCKRCQTRITILRP